MLRPNTTTGTWEKTSGKVRVSVPQTMMTRARITEERPMVSMMMEMTGSPIIRRRNIFSMKKPIRKVKTNVRAKEARNGTL